MVSLDAVFESMPSPPKPKRLSWSDRIGGASRPRLFSQDLNDETQAADIAEVMPARRYTLGSTTLKHIKNELQAKEQHHEADLNASLDHELHRSISKLFDDDDAAAEADASDQSSAADSPALLVKPKLTRGYTVGVSGRNHLMWDIHATHQLDLHEALYSKPVKRDEPTGQNPLDWLVKLDNLRKTAGKAGNQSPSSTISCSSTSSPTDSPPRPGSPVCAVANAAESDAERQSLGNSPGVETPPQIEKPTSLRRWATYERNVHTALQDAFNAQAPGLPQLTAGAYQDPLGAAEEQGALPPAPFDNGMGLPMMPAPGVPPQWQMFQMQQQQLFHQQQIYQQQQQQLFHQQQLLQQQQAQPFFPMTMPVGFGGFSTEAPPMRAPMHAHAASSPPHLPPARSPSAQLPAGRLVDIAKQQEGSRALQRALASMSPVRLQEACAELGPYLGELATNLFGNYLVSSMASLPEAQPWVEKALRGRVVELMKHAQGSRVVQAALDALPSKAVHALVGELEGHVAATSMSVNGSWSVCAAFKVTRSPFIVREIAESMGRLATQHSGSRAVQKILPEAASHDVDTRCVVAALVGGGAEELMRLANDQYGNYVVQIALRIAASDEALREQLVALLLPSLPQLSTSKAGSNVAEAVIGCASDEQLVSARTMLLGSGIDLATHCFGKHVMAALHRRV